MATEKYWENNTSNKGTKTSMRSLFFVTFNVGIPPAYLVVGLECSEMQTVFRNIACLGNHALETHATATTAGYITSPVASDFCKKKKKKKNSVIATAASHC